MKLKKKKKDLKRILLLASTRCIELNGLFVSLTQSVAKLCVLRNRTTRVKWKISYRTVVNRSWRSFGNPDFPGCESAICRSWAFSFSSSDFPRNKTLKPGFCEKKKSLANTFACDSWLFFLHVVFYAKW